MLLKVVNSVVIRFQICIFDILNTARVNTWITEHLL